MPTIVIVGRPNVGKSTLFNRITGERRSIVGDESGITRDRIHGQAEFDGKPFEIIDTGGIVVRDEEYIPSQILKQAEFALERADQIILLVDGRSEITAPDRDLALMLRKLGRPITLAVNKADTGKVGCEGGLQFTILSSGKLMTFAIPKPDMVLLKHNSDVTFDFTCGPQKAFPIAVEYVPAEHQGKVAGDVKMLEFQGNAGTVCKLTGNPPRQPHCH